MRGALASPFGATAAVHDAPPVPWRRNLAVCWLRSFVTAVGMTLVTPFLPLFIAELIGALLLTALVILPQAFVHTPWQQ